MGKPPLNDAMIGQNDYELKDVVANVAIVVTIALFLTGLFICKEIRTKGSTVDISPLPFLTGCFSCTIWLFYGIAINDSSLCIVNGTGAVLQISYIIYFYTMTSNRKDIHKKLAALVAVISSVLVLIYTFHEDSDRMTQILGLIASSGTLIFLSSPLADIVNVCRTKSTKTLPFPLIFTSFLMALLWSVYGILIDDRVVQIPNMIATLITVVQLFLFVIYREPKTFSFKHNAYV